MKSQTIWGIVFIILGFLLSITIIGAVYGIPLVLIGIFLIVFRNAESEIEQIKKPKKGKKK